MPCYPRQFSILILVSYQVFLSIASIACYNPDQIVPDPPTLPCNTASGVHSACCAPGDACTNTGYCLSAAAGYVYRGGCTDITWNSPNCRPGCRDSTWTQSWDIFWSPPKSGWPMIANIGDFSNLYACPTIIGSASHFWCCGTPSNGYGASVGCCNGSTVFEPDFGGGPLVVALANAANPNPSTLTTSSSLFTTSPSSIISSIALIASEPAPTPTKIPVESSSNPSQPSRNSVALGTGIGVSVGALLLFGLVFLFLRERRRRVHTQKMADHGFKATQGKAINGIRSYEMNRISIPQELEHVEHRPEILSQEVYEANGGLWHNPIIATLPVIFGFSIGLSFKMIYMLRFTRARERPRSYLRSTFLLSMWPALKVVNNSLGIFIDIKRDIVDEFAVLYSQIASSFLSTIISN